MNRKRIAACLDVYRDTVYLCVMSCNETMQSQLYNIYEVKLKSSFPGVEGRAKRQVSYKRVSRQAGNAWCGVYGTKY